MTNTERDLETVMSAAQAAKEVACFTALALLQTEGDGNAALAILKRFEDVAPPRSLAELDCVALGEQAIREAMALRGERGVVL